MPCTPAVERRCFTSGGTEVVHAEQFFIVQPAALKLQAGSCGHGGKSFKRVFVGIFCVNGLAFFEFDMAAVAAHALYFFAHQMHLYATLVAVPSR
jgi:hypothetical protein